MGLIESIHNITMHNISLSPLLPKPMMSKAERVQSQAIFCKEYLPKGRTMGACIYITGEWSSGKSLTADFMAVEKCLTYELPIVSNMRFNLPNTYMLDDIEVIKKLDHSVVIIDEIRRYMDSYMSASQKTRFISNLCADLGKQSCDFYFTDQHWNAAPTRIKTNVMMYLLPQYDENSEWCYVYCFWNDFDLRMCDPFFYFAFHAPDYWDYFKTEQKIEDYHLRFKPITPAYQFVMWALGDKDSARLFNNTPEELELTPKQVYSEMSDYLAYWNTIEGIGYSSKEMYAILFYIEKKLVPELRSGAIA